MNDGRYYALISSMDAQYKIIINYAVYKKTVTNRAERNRPMHSLTNQGDIHVLPVSMVVTQ